MQDQPGGAVSAIGGMPGPRGGEIDEVGGFPRLQSVGNRFQWAVRASKIAVRRRHIFEIKHGQNCSVSGVWDVTNRADPRKIHALFLSAKAERIGTRQI